MASGIISFLVLSLLVSLFMGCQAQVERPSPSPTALIPTPRPIITNAPTIPPAKKEAVTPQSAPYYQGKAIEIFVEAAPGGGTDLLARISGKFLSRYIPGKPDVVIRNMPGAARVTNTIYNRTRPDGLTLGQASGASLGRQQRKLDIVQYDMARFKYLYTVSRGADLVMIRKGAQGRLTDPTAKALFIGTKGGEGNSQGPLIWGKEILGWNLRWVLGFAGNNEVEMAIRRGEIDVLGTSDDSGVRTLMQEGLAEPYTTVGNLKGNKFVRRDDFPGVSTFEELLGNKKPSGLSWEAYLVWIGSDQVDKYLMAPPNTPDNMMSLLSEASARMLADPEFDQTMKTTVASSYSMNVGKEAQEVVRQLLNVSPQAVDYGAELQRKFTGTQLAKGTPP
ncbi:MAG: hypothetical protein HY673_18330 [Chloroflexi bacterium]|nr:hypothetical protein [Chloroflexota bacterium]